eukprot:981440-Pyramimonas_sp.AAC.1
MGWTLDDLPDGQLRVWAWGSFLEVISSGVKIVGGVFGTDGSGGEHGRDWRLRRCGWSVVHLDPDSLEVRGVLCGTLPTVGMCVQSSPRAELFALHQLLVYTEGPIHVYIDYQPIVAAFRRKGAR